MRILVVEDEHKAAAFLRKGLSESGFIVDVAEDGEDGLFKALNFEHDLLVLDAMLPLRDGWSLLSELRQAGKSMPVLFLTARDAVPDRVKGLELGADDYLNRGSGAPPGATRWAAIGPCPKGIRVIVASGSAAGRSAVACKCHA